MMFMLPSLDHVMEGHGFISTFISPKASKLGKMEDQDAVGLPYR